jgi:hypothetical protein
MGSGRDIGMVILSEAVNRPHGAGRIEKVRKGRENLIRLAEKRG